jgi:predicted peptidase
MGFIEFENRPMMIIIRFGGIKLCFAGLATGRCCLLIALKPAMPRNPFASTVVGLTLIAAACGAQDRQQTASFRGKVEVPVGYHYLRYLPPGYQEKPDAKWPLVIFLHGAGERGDDLEVLKKHGPTKHIAAGEDYPAIVVSPQCPKGEIWDAHGVHALTQEIMRSHRVDVDRVYLTGLSMGGFGTWETVMVYPQTYAAVMPICGGAGVRFVMTETIKQVPEWIFHGEKDTVVDPSCSKRMADALKKDGANVRLTLYPDLSHDCWTVTYANPEVWAWLFAQSRTH